MSDFRSKHPQFSWSKILQTAFAGRGPEGAVGTGDSKAALTTGLTPAVCTCIRRMAFRQDAILQNDAVLPREDQNRSKTPFRTNLEWAAGWTRAIWPQPLGPPVDAEVRPPTSLSRWHFTGAARPPQTPSWGCREISARTADDVFKQQESRTDACALPLLRR